MLLSCPKNSCISQESQSIMVASARGIVDCVTANGRSQADRDFSCVRNMNCSLAAQQLAHLCEVADCFPAHNGFGRGIEIIVFNLTVPVWSKDILTSRVAASETNVHTEVDRLNMSNQLRGNG